MDLNDACTRVRELYFYIVFIYLLSYLGCFSCFAIRLLSHEWIFIRLAGIDVVFFLFLFAF